MEDKKKSPFKEVAQEDLFPKDLPEGKYIKAFLVENAKGDVVNAYMLDDNTEKEATDALLKAADTLNNYHAMMRIELTEGW